MGRTTFDVSIDEWGDEPPIHKPCFELTHRPSPPVERRGGTSFTFVTSLGEALRRATLAAEGGDVVIMGGAATVAGFLAAGKVDELQLNVVPVLLGRGVRLFDGGGLEHLHLRPVSASVGAEATHLVYRVAPSDARE
ncbi:hypothetical protein BH23DEI1_BH23DEI1_14230 [soil metagenome]